MRGEKVEIGKRQDLTPVIRDPSHTHKTLIQACERVRAQIRARVEHPFHVLKNLFHFTKTRYKGLAKNTAMLFGLFGLANLVLLKPRLLQDLKPPGIGAP